MRNEGNHTASVDSWLKRAAVGRPPAQLLTLFEAALAALWSRTETTLGEVTLTAVADRVAHNAAEKYTFFASLKVEPLRGITCEQLHRHIGDVRGDELTAGIRFVLIELLNVLGNLTAELLTEELHAELAMVEVQQADRVENGASNMQSPGRAARTTGEGFSS